MNVVTIVRCMRHCQAVPRCDHAYDCVLHAPWSSPWSVGAPALCAAPHVGSWTAILTYSFEPAAGGRCDHAVRYLVACLCAAAGPTAVCKVGYTCTCARTQQKARLVHKMRCSQAHTPTMSRVVRSHPLQDRQVAAICHKPARVLDPVAAILPQPQAICQAKIYR